MNAKMFAGILSLALVIGLAPGISAAADPVKETTDEVTEAVPTMTLDEHNACQLALPGDTCASEEFDYAGGVPTLDFADTVAAVGTFDVTVAETLFDGYEISCSFTVVATEIVDETCTEGDFGAPFPGFPVEVTGEASGAAAPSVTATVA